MKTYLEYITKFLVLAALVSGIICIEHLDELIRILIVNYTP